MMGLGHYKKKPGEKDKDAKKNAMAEGGLGTGFTAEQCELMMQDINGFCLEVLK
jgi:hypothetical protein